MSEREWQFYVQDMIGFADRVLAQCGALVRHGPPSGHRRRRRALAGLALAATVLLAMLPGVWWRPSRPPQLDAPAGTIAAADVLGERAVAPGELLRTAFVDQARETYQPLLVAASESLASVTDALPGASAPATAAQDGMPASMPTAWDGEFVAGIRPVAASAGRSVAALLRILPGSARALEGEGVTQ